MAQTVITASPAAGIAGTFASGTASPHNTRSAIAAETITVGKFVVNTAGADTCELPDAQAEAASGRGLGIALRPASGATSYATGEEVKIGYSGEFWVVGEDTGIAIGDPVFVRGADAGTYGLGSFRSDADTADAVQLPNAVFLGAVGTAGALVKVWLNGPFI
ncbi:MAG: hypothetical protein OEV36_02400 [Myxococcales bacterium]|nr:hypothetical protein [Myxococcales bacterium]